MYTASGFTGMEWWNGIVEWNGIANYICIEYLCVTVVSRGQTLFLCRGIIAFSTSAHSIKGLGGFTGLTPEEGGHAHISQYIMF